MLEMYASHTRQDWASEWEKKRRRIERRHEKRVAFSDIKKNCYINVIYIVVYNNNEKKKKKRVIGVIVG